MAGITCTWNDWKIHLYMMPGIIMYKIPGKYKCKVTGIGMYKLQE
jgi:hypothetical protein